MELLRQYAMSFIGLPYIWGGDDAIKGFDCSGLVQEILSSIGVDPRGDQTAQGLYNYFRDHGVHNSTGLGALCFYGVSHSRIVHVGFALDSLRMIEAGGGGSKTTSVSKAEKDNAYVRIRPIRSRKDFFAIIKPNYPTILS